MRDGFMCCFERERERERVREREREREQQFVVLIPMERVGVRKVVLPTALSPRSRTSYELVSLSKTTSFVHLHLAPTSRRAGSGEQTVVLKGRHV